MDQDHLALDLYSQDQYRETTPGPTACTNETKALAVSMSEPKDSSGKETSISAKRHLNSSQKRANRQDAQFQILLETEWRQTVEQHRADHREKKRKLRRRRLVGEADRIQDESYEPMHVSPFNALPHFEYLDIAEALDKDVPPELFGFNSLSFSAAGTPQESRLWGDKLLSGPFAESKRFRDSAQPHLQSVPLEGMDYPKTPHDKENAYRPYVAQGNLLCIFKTCPIQEMHCEGPYHHNSK
ncbi:MAG: hypothetical protein Q9195_002075 [Heterodermia aff. obscurata]